VQEDFLNIIINHSINLPNRIPQDTFIKIDGIEYDVDFREVLKENGTDKRIFKVYGSYSPTTSFFEWTDSVDRSIVIRIREGDFYKLQHSRMVKNSIYLRVTCKIDYEQYLYNNERYLLQKCQRHPDIYMHRLGETDRITLTQTEIAKIVVENNLVERILLELPLKEESPNNDLNQAIKSLRIAAEGFKEGNYETILINTRNAVYNDLTELKTKGSRKERVLKSTILDSCMMRCPESDRKIYAEVLKEVSKIAASLVSILSKFIHKDQQKIIKIPLENDLEAIYFSLSLIVRYLTRLSVYYI
jgi:hypothetical protein